MFGLFCWKAGFLFKSAGARLPSTFCFSGGFRIKEFQKHLNNKILWVDGDPNAKLLFRGQKMVQSNGCFLQDIMKSLERAIEFGSPVLLENVGQAGSGWRSFASEEYRELWALETFEETT